MARTTTSSVRKSRKAPAARTRRPARRNAPRRRAAARAAPNDPEIQDFLERFTRSLTSGDGEGAAACFEYPAIMVMANAAQSGGNQVLQDRGTVAAFFAQAPEQYHAKGIEETFPDIEDVQWLADDLALVRVRFPYVDADGNDLGDGETSLYVVRRSGDGHAICAAVTLGTDSDRAEAGRSSD